MAKKGKGAPQAPQAPAGGTKGPESAAPAGKTPVVDFNAMMAQMNESAKMHPEGLDPNHQVDLMKMMHETFRMDPNAAERYHMSPESVAKINELTAIGQMVIFANEVEYGRNPFAIRMHVHQIETINSLMHDMGIGFNMNALPAPSAEGVIDVPSSAITVSKDAKKALKEEHETSEKKTLNPKDIETEEQLIDSIKQIMITRPSVYDKIKESINFYQAYLKIQAAKAENKDEKLAEINNKSRAQLLNEIASIVGSCPLVLSGMGHFLYSTVAGTKSPVSAFCKLRDATKSKKTSMPAMTDEEIADYVTILIKWAANIKIAEFENRIETCNKDIEVLSKDKKKNAVAIESAEKKIEANKNNIEHVKEVLSYVTNPSYDVVDNFLDDYANRESEGYNAARKMFKCVTDTYYDDIVIEEMNQNTVKHNVQQYMGIITNLFHTPGETSVNYTEGNIVELQPISLDENGGENKPEEKPAEEESKNA